MIRYSKVDSVGTHPLEGKSYAVTILGEFGITRRVIHGSDNAYMWFVHHVISDRIDDEPIVSEISLNDDGNPVLREVAYTEGDEEGHCRAYWYGELIYSLRPHITQLRSQRDLATTTALYATSSPPRPPVTMPENHVVHNDFNVVYSTFPF